MRLILLLSLSFLLSIFKVWAQEPQFTSTPVTMGTYNTAYTYNITTTGPDGLDREIIATGTLPVGISLTDHGDGTATLDGAPAETGTFTFTLTVQLVTDNSQNSDQPVELEIEKGTAIVSLNGLMATYDGTPQEVTATTTPSGLTVDITYDGIATVPENAGSYAVVGTINDANYQGSASGTLEIEKATATVTLSGLMATYDGTPQEVTATTVPSGLTVDITYDGVATVPENAGSYAVVGTINDANYQGSASGTLEIEKGTATVSLNGLTATYDGIPHPVTATTVPSGLTVDFTYDGIVTVPENVGSYAVVGTINDANYQGSATGTLVIEKMMATLTLNDLTTTYDGNPQNVTATTTPPGLTVDFTYDGSAVAPTNAGSYAVVGMINDVNYQGNASGMLIINKAAATLTLTGLSAGYDGNPHAASATTTPSGLTVDFTYDGTATAPTNAGSYAVEGTINDINYLGSASGALVIDKAMASITLIGLIKTYDGTPQTVSATTAPSGLTVDLTYDGSISGPTNAGSYSVLGTINNTNYNGTQSGTLVINKATASIAITNLLQNFDGSPKPVVVTTNPTGLAVTTTYDGSSTVPSVQGTYVVDAVISEANYQGSSSEILVINGPPTSSGIPDVNVNEDAVNYDIDLSEIFDDQEDMDANMTFTIEANSQPSLFSNVTINSGILSLNFAENQNGSASITIRATDTGNMFIDNQFNVNIAAIQDDPEFQTEPPTGAVQGMVYTYDVLATDPDIGDVLTYTNVAIPDWLSFTDNGDGSGTLTGTPGNEDVGNDAVALEVSDDKGNSDSQIFTISITNSNDAPVFTSVPIEEATEGVSYTYNITTSDADAGDTRSITATEIPDWLLLTDNNNGSATLKGIPGNDDGGANDVTLRVTDSFDDFTEQSFSIVVNNANNPPEFVSSPITSVDEDALYTYNIEASDPDNEDVLEIIALAKPSWLTLNDNGNGTATLTGTPTNNNVGDNSVVLNVSDAEGASVNQNFTIEVNNTNDSPSFTSTAVTAAIQGSEYIYNISTTDPDVGDTRVITATTLPTWLTLIDQGNGTAKLSGTPTNEDFGSNSVTLKVEDEAGATAIQSFVINVDNANDPPSFTSSPKTEATEDVAYVYNITTSDPDAGDSRNITALSLPVWLNLTDNGNGTAVLSGTPLNNNVGNHTVVLNVKDGLGANVNQNFTINVQNTNDPPVFTSTPLTSAIQNVAYNYSITTSDPDVGDTRSLSAVTKPGWLTFTDNGNGTATLSGTPSNVNLGANNVKISVTDVTGETTFQTFVINVDNSNDPPSFTSTPITTAIEDAVYTYNVQTSDPDAGDILEIRALTIPAWLNFTDNGNGTALLTGTPKNADVGTDNVVLNVEDGQGLSVNQNFSITISNTNDPPVFTSTPVTGAIQGVQYTYNIFTSDPDIGDSRMITSAVLPSWLSLVDNGNGSAQLTGTPTNLNTGANPVKLVVTDEDGAAIEQTFIINVDNANDPPAFTSTALTIATEDVKYTYNITTSDPDNGDTRSITALSIPSWLSLTDNNDGTAVLQGTPLNGNVGNHSVVLNVKDALGANVNQSFTISVSNVNDAPSFSSSPVTFAIQNSPYVYNITTTDPDAGDTRNITVTSKPSWLSFTDNGDGTAILSGTPGNPDLGQHEVILNVADKQGAAVDQIFTINVDNSNDPPAFTSSPVTNVEEDSPYLYEITTSDPDQGDNRTIIALSKPPWLTLNDRGDGTAVLSGIPLNQQVGTHSVVLQVEDAQGASVNQSFDINVKNINDAPVFTSTPITGAIQDAMYTYNITTADPDLNDNRSITGSIIPAWLSLIDNGDGTATLSGTPSNANFGSNPVVLTVTDNAGAAVNQNFTINVDNSNDQPIFTSSPVLSVNEDAVYQYNIKTSDPDVGDTRTITSLSSLPIWLTLNDNGDGTALLSGTPTNENVGSYNIVLKVQDAIGSSDTQSFTIVVVNVNDIPLFTSNPITTARQNIAYTYNITTSDIDAGDTREITATSLPSWLSLVDNGNGTAQLTGTHPINPDNGNLQYDIELKVEDGQGASSDQPFTVTVTFENQPPTLDPIADPMPVDEDSGEISIALTGISAGTGESQTITLSVTSDNIGLVDNFNVDYQSPQSTGIITFTPVENAFGEVNITVKVTDSGAEVKNNIQRAFKLVVNPVNDPPVFTSTPVTKVVANQNYDYNITTMDPDPTDDVVITNSVLPSWLNFVNNGDGTATISGTVPAAGLGDQDMVSLTATDNMGKFATQSFTLSFNHPPQLLSDIEVAINEDTPLSIPLTLFSEQFEDEDPGDNIVFVKIVSLPVHGTLQLNNNTLAIGDNIDIDEENSLRYTPEVNYNGADAFTWNASDGLDLANNSRNVDITITPVNDKPTIEIGSELLQYSQGERVAITDSLDVEIFDVDNNSMHSAQIHISKNYVVGEDFLEYDNQQNIAITGSFDPSTGTMTLSGIASNNSYEEAIWSVLYRNTILGETDITEKEIEVIVNDGNAMSNPDMIKIVIDEVFPDVNLVNAFTPNGDGQNDLWDFKNLEYYSVVDISVYTDDGVEVFGCSDNNCMWDGTYEGKELPAGPYYYIIDLNNGKRQYKGTVTILK